MAFCARIRTMKTKKTKSSSFIKKARQSMGLTQEKLAKRLKIKRYNLAKYERSLSMPSGDLIIEIQDIENK